MLPSIQLLQVNLGIQVSIDMLNNVYNMVHQQKDYSKLKKAYNTLHQGTTRHMQWSSEVIEPSYLNRPTLTQLHHGERP